MRGARIAVAATERFAVTVVLGGERPPDIAFGDATVVQLPPVKAGPQGFAALVTPDGGAVDDALRQARRDLLLATFAAVDPDVLLIEAFPFGRRAMRFELLPLLEAAAARHPRPLVASSIRDILQENRAAARDAETVDLVRRAFDRVLVHGDPRLVRLEDSFPLAAAIADRVEYTGIVGPGPERPAASVERVAVIVSVGGGAVGAELIGTALAARPLSALADQPWLVLTGPNLPAAQVPAEAPGVAVRPFVSDLPNRLRRARLSISQVGYNTVADLLAAPDCRAVLVPHVGRGETEQTRRAALMERAGLGVALPAEGLTPRRLAEAIDRALAMPQCETMFDRDGAAASATILHAAWRARTGRLD